MTQRISFRPVGYVRNDVVGARYSEWGEVESDIVIDDRLADALDGIEDYSHIMVLFYIAGVTRRQRAIRRLHPRDRQDAPLVGVFATHSQYRPNPIGVTVARLLQRHGATLRVRGLDAYNGTPVLDIKGFTPDAELAQAAQIPQWLSQLRKENA